MIKKYNVGELRRLIKESQNEFKPIAFGRDESKKINDKTYSDIKKETLKYDGGLSSKKREKKNDDSLEKDDNRGMSDLEYSNISKGFKDKVKSQMKGYVSKDAEDKPIDLPEIDLKSYPPKAVREKEFKKLIMDEIRGKDEEFYDKWCNNEN